MKAIDVLRCIMYMDLCGEDFNMIEVPTVDDEWNPQTIDWWFSMIGGCPKSLVESGNYLCFYPNDARDWLHTSDDNYIPYEVVDVDDNIVYLYKLES
jgi:hypothetical protein